MENKYVFEISLSVLNHLGRNLYRNFITVLGEAVSNSWDADAKNVWIYINRDENHLVIKDSGSGMDDGDFKHKFLKVGYSKRIKGGKNSPGGRPYIGAKGIGKLALLSCAERVNIISKTSKTDYVGGIIDNSELNQAIKQDLTPDKYPLELINIDLFNQYKKKHKHGTIIYFDKIKEDIKNTIPHLRKLIALYFRFSLIDPSFNIFVNDEPVSLKDLKDLSDSTEFAWNINKLDDPYLSYLTKIKKGITYIYEKKMNIKAFIATVEKPRYLKIAGTEEKVGIDLFVNGRLRETNILKHLPDFSTRHIASYLYGQIHFNELDEGDIDRFGTSREGMVPGDKKFAKLIEVLKKGILETISDQWDDLRLEFDKDGDDENPRKSLKARRARSLYNLSSEDYKNLKDKKVTAWIKELRPDAEFNIPSYSDCFLSENLVRQYIKEKQFSLESKREIITKWRTVEEKGKINGNLTINIRESDNDSYYLDMEDLVKLTEQRRGFPPNTLLTDETQFTPIRNAVMHTSRLTEEAKNKLTTVFDNIKGKIRDIFLKEDYK